MRDKGKGLATPFSEEDVQNLKSGDKVLLNGIIYTARDEAHKRLIQLIKKNEPLPFNLRGQVIYYVGPSPARPGMPIGAAGPTTSYRMDPYAPDLIARGLKGMIGKGSRSKSVKDAIKKYKAVYFAAIGGAGALIARSIISANIIAYKELGPEAIYQLEVKDLPLIVVNDMYGGDFYEEGVKRYAR